MGSVLDWILPWRSRPPRVDHLEKQSKEAFEALIEITRELRDIVWRLESVVGKIEIGDDDD